MFSKQESLENFIRYQVSRECALLLFHTFQWNLILYKVAPLVNEILTMNSNAEFFQGHTLYSSVNRFLYILNALFQASSNYTATFVCVCRLLNV